MPDSIRGYLLIKPQSMLAVGEQIQVRVRDIPVNGSLLVRARRRVGRQPSPAAKTQSKKIESRIPGTTPLGRGWFEFGASDKNKSLRENYTRGRLSCCAPAVDRLAPCRLRGCGWQGFGKVATGVVPGFRFWP